MIPRSRPETPWIVLLAIAAAGLALRIAAARGGLWLDEAWSASFARDVGTPAGVFLNIHHDNNHHLNTLWLQMVGSGAAPVVQRALSIATGTAAIVMAGLILTARGWIASIIAATLFAVSPILVIYGSEARGYAPMLLAFLTLVLIVGRWLDRPGRHLPHAGLAILCLIGTLAQMTMIFGVCAVTGWVALRRWQAAGVRVAAADTAYAMGVPAAVTLMTIAAIVRLLPGPGGFTIGSFFPFRPIDLAAGQADMVRYTLGFPILSGALTIAIGLVLTGGAIALSRPPRRGLYLLAILGIPAGCALFQLGNVAIARYFLVGSVALLLLLAEALAGAFSRGGAWRLSAIFALAALLLGLAWQNIRLLGNGRADPAAAITQMKRRAPDGAIVTLDRPRAAPVIRIAAIQTGYRADIGDCGRFLFVDRDGGEVFPAAPMHCGRAYRPIASAHPLGLSGSHWTLYERGP